MGFGNTSGGSGEVTKILYKVWAYFPNVKRSRRQLRRCARDFKGFLKEMEKRDYEGLWFVPNDTEGQKVAERYFKYQEYYLREMGKLRYD